MLIRHIYQANNVGTPERKGTERVETEEYISDRLILAADKMGYSVHLTTLKAGINKEMEYTAHLESCYCISGTGTITELSTGKSHSLAAGVLYGLDKNDRHRVETKDGMDMLCIFNPAIGSAETTS